MNKFFFITCMVCCFTVCSSKRKSSGTENGVLVVTTSSWIAAYAQAAGAENIVILAPFDMQHPSEYELRPGDIPKILNAEVIVYGGYEVMMERLKKGLDIPPEKFFQINTVYNYETIEKSVMALATRLGTENVARENLSDIRNAFEEGRKAIFDIQGAGLPVVLHRLHAPLAKELGLIPVMFFGPAAPEAAEIFAVSKTNAIFVLDNRHNPVGKPLDEVLPDAQYRQWLNFPGYQGTRTLVDVIRYNVTQLTQ